MFHKISYLLKKFNLSYYHTFLYSSVVLLVLFSVVASISAFGTHRISIKGSRHLLETRAMDMAVTIGFTIENVGIFNGMFHELAMKDKWEDLAFIALFDNEGRVLMHSNSFLIGEVKGDSYVAKVLKNENVVFHDFILGTGETVFVLDFPLKLHLHKESGKEEATVSESRQLADLIERGSITQAPESMTYCLRVALHTYPARSIVRQANFQLAIIAVSLLILWVLAMFVINTWRRNIRLETKLAEQERMAVLGRMAAVLAHEIRNPLASIRGFAQINLECNSDNEMGSDMQIIVNETERLEHLTSNLLTYAKPVKVVRSQFELKDYCFDIEKYWSQNKLPVEVDVKVEVLCTEGIVYQDREKITQIVLNLVKNGIEASIKNEGKRVEVKIVKEDERLVIEVRDSGKGVPNKLKDKLFEPFFTTRTRGTGLGLAIVKRLTLLMDGKITVHNSSNQGAIFKIVLPDLVPD